MCETNPDERVGEETDRLYRFLGQYVAIFQWMEAQLDQILLLAFGHDHWSETQAKLAGMQNAHKLKEVQTVVAASSPFGRSRERPGWSETFGALIERMRQEARRRNGIVHSQYLFEFVESGMPPLRSKRHKKGAVAEFGGESLDPDRTDIILRELAALAFDLSQARIQLVHWYAPKPMD